MLIQVLDKGSGREWDCYVDAHPLANCYHHRAWDAVAREAYHLSTRFLIARESEGSPICGAFPLFEVHGMLRPHITNGLFGSYAPVLADTDEAREALLDHARRLFLCERVPHFMLKTVEEDEWLESRLHGFARLDSWAVARLRLDGDPERMWGGFRDKIRNCVRKAQKSGLEARSGADQLEAFYDVLCENMHQKGTPIYGIGFMRTLVEGFGDRAEILTLRSGGRAVSGALLLFHRKTTFVPFASSRPADLHMSPNNLLYWEIIRRSCLRGMDTLDFGRSLRGSGPLAFKLGWGAELISQPCFVRSQVGEPMPMDTQTRSVAMFVRQWKRMPRMVTDALGPVICRQLAGLL